MKRKNLFIILCVATIVFTGCSKKETPVMSNSVETITSEETVTEEVKDNNQESEHVSGSGEMTDELAADNEKYKDSTSSDDYELTEEDKQRIEEAVQKQKESEGIDSDAVVKEEIKDAMSQDPDAPDPSLTQEDLDFLDSLFEGNDDNPEYYDAGSIDTPKEDGLTFFGDDHVRDWN